MRLNENVPAIFYFVGTFFSGRRVISTQMTAYFWKNVYIFFSK